MGGIADYTGSMVCELSLDCAAATALQLRDDRLVQVVSLNLLDEHQPFTLQIPIDALAHCSTAELKKEFSEPGRKFAGYILGCLHLLHKNELIDLNRRDVRGMNLAVYSTVPIGAGVSSSAAIEVSAMMNFADHFNIRKQMNLMQMATLCQQVENQIVGAPCGIMDQVTSLAGVDGALLQLRCQPHELLSPLAIPTGMRFIGINTGVRHNVGGKQYGKTRCAAFMGHKIILEKMREMGKAGGKTLVADPMNGYLANLSPDDYKKYFRPYLPESIKGGEFMLRYSGTIDPQSRITPDDVYAVQAAVDHHVLEAMRVRNFSTFLEQANTLPAGSDQRGITLDKAGHLMYASHLSYTNDAKLGAPECDLLVDLIRKYEKKGLYGAKITGGGSGGTVAILCEINPKADTALAEIMKTYAEKTGKSPELLNQTGPGAWNLGTMIIDKF